MGNSISYQFCFDLSFDEKLKYFVPVGYVLDNCEPITYVDKKATLEIIKSFNIDYQTIDANVKQLLSICESIKPVLLFKKFEKNTKSKRTILDLLADDKSGKVIRNYIDLKINQFLLIINEFDFPISINLSKDKDFEVSRIAPQAKGLQTKLLFDKNSLGMQYTLLLNENDKFFYPMDQQFIFLLNDPSWLVFDKKMYHLHHINSNKLTPFLKKKTIDIPEKLLADYFSKFIKDIVKKVDIEATGFDVVQKQSIVGCKIQVVHDFFKDKYNIELLFDYDGFSFLNSSLKKTNVILENKTETEIQVIQFKRDFDAELVCENKLLSIGFEKTHNNLFVVQDSKNQFETIDFLIANKEIVANQGFEFDDLLISNKKIQTKIATITTSNDEKNDWFDLKMTVFCGKFEFSFVEIIANIKNNNRFFELPDGSFFLIPMEWMTKYAPLVNFARVKSNNLHLPKSNYTILENLNLLDISLTANDEIAYSESNLLKATLRNYQIDGVKWLLKNHNLGLGVCLADDMGLGKTLQTLAALVNIQETLNAEIVGVPQDLFSIYEQKTEPLRALIVAPSSLVFNWYNEAQKFVPHFKRLQYIGNDRKLLAKKIDKYDLIFTSYSVITRDIETFDKFNFRYLIIDESQQIKNRDSKVFKAISAIKTEHKLSLSGTPIENSLNDLWSQMQFINPDILGDFKFFTNYFKNPIEKQKNENRLVELKNIVNPFILRRTKEQVLDDLPELTEQIVYCEMDVNQEKWYETEKSKARNELLKIEVASDRINVLNVLLKLRQLSNHPKILDSASMIASGKFLAVTNYIQTLLLAGHKMLIFSSFVTHLEIYEKWCNENNISFCKLIGATKTTERENQVKQFQENDNLKIFFISLKSGGVGLNLTSASFVLLLDPWWNPFAERQAIARAHRMGQQNKVNAVRFISKNTIEEKIILLQEKKKLLSESILEIDIIPADLNINLNYLLE